MKRIFSIFLIMCLTMGLMAGCGPSEEQKEEPKEEAQQEQEVQDSEKEDDSEEAAETEYATVTGEFQGLADGHSVEILVDGEYEMYSFYDDNIGAKLESMDPETKIQFDVEIKGSGMPVITKLYDQPAEG